MDVQDATGRGERSLGVIERWVVTDLYGVLEEMREAFATFLSTTGG